MRWVLTATGRRLPGSVAVSCRHWAIRRATTKSKVHRASLANLALTTRGLLTAAEAREAVGAA